MASAATNDVYEFGVGNGCISTASDTNARLMHSTRSG